MIMTVLGEMQSDASYDIKQLLWDDEGWHQNKRLEQLWRNDLNNVYPVELANKLKNFTTLKIHVFIIENLRF